MKKLMIAAAAIAFAAMTQAAQVTWSFTAPAETDVTAGYYGVLIDAAAYDSLDKAIAAVMKDGASASGVMYAANGIYSSNKGGIVAMAQTKKDVMSGTYTAGQDVNYWSILFDGSVGADATAKNYYNTTATPTDATASKAGQFSDATLLLAQLGTVSAGSWTAVPEPTSGLLLLLGVAGLALRRRRA